MAISPTVTFSGDIAEKLQRLAELRQQNVHALLEALLNQAWRQEKDDVDVSVVSDNDSEADFDDATTPEMEAYIALHPQLKEKYFGQYVAIYQGELVDHSAEHETLYRRIAAKYPDEFVWISEVEEEAIPTLAFRSPRIEWNETA